MKTARILGLVMTTALASTTLSGCAGKVAPSAAMSAEGAKAALAKGKGEKAVSLAEAAALASPRDAGTRALLGAAYLEAGRFASAASALNDAIQLGDSSSRTLLTYSLALSALGRYPEAQALLATHESKIDPVDFGLAITLAGSPQQGVEALSNALRYGENTPKLRQNLAYAFALSGDWRSARLLAAQDVTADKLDDRLGEWAALSTPQQAMHRVASLLGVTAREDKGQPVHLALSNFPTNEQLAAESATNEAGPAAGAALAQAELPAADAIAAPSEEVAIAAFDPTPVATSSTPAAPRIRLPKPTPAKAPVRVAAKPVAAKPSPAFQAAFVRQPGAYRVQLGSYASASAASDAWTRFQKRHPELKGAERLVTKADVNGKTYYRVAAGGFAKASAVSFCSRVKSAGGGCLAYAGTLPTGPAAKPAVRTAAGKQPTRVAAR